MHISVTNAAYSFAIFFHEYILRLYVAIKWDCDIDKIVTPSVRIVYSL
jgi:hypothetical protein